MINVEYQVLAHNPLLFKKSNNKPFLADYFLSTLHYPHITQYSNIGNRNFWSKSYSETVNKLNYFRIGSYSIGTFNNISQNPYIKLVTLKESEEDNALSALNSHYENAKYKRTNFGAIIIPIKSNSSNERNLSSKEITTINSLYKNYQNNEDYKLTANMDEDYYQEEEQELIQTLSYLKTLNISQDQISFLSKFNLYGIQCILRFWYSAYPING
ncbi:unnamed protein product [Gordionus sp. m RMFG-2023]